MRRKDREVTDPALIQDIIQRCEVCRIGFNAPHHWQEGLGI